MRGVIEVVWRKLVGSDANAARRGGQCVRIFDPEGYVQENPDVAASGMDPLQHYIEYGKQEGRSPLPIFDRDYYAKRNPDVVKAGVDPLEHFLDHGWRELRDPSAAFDMTCYWLEHLADTAPATNPIEHFINEGRARGLTPSPARRRTAAERQWITQECRRLLYAEHPDQAVLSRVGRIFETLGLWADAEEAYRKLLEDSWQDTRTHRKLASMLMRQGKTWQLAETLLVVTAQDPGRAGWWHALGEAQQKMQRYHEAVSAYERAIALDPSRSGWHADLGYCFELAGDKAASERAYASAVALDADGLSFGIGALHQRCGRWREAIAAYARETARRPLDAPLHARLAQAYENCWLWDQARDSYRAAIALDPAVTRWHFQLGLVYERLGQWSMAAAAYGHACRDPNGAPSWHYRWGVALAELGRYEQACHALAQAAGISLQRQSQTTESRRLSCIPAPSDDLAYLSGFDPLRPYSRALEVDRTDFRLHQRLGHALEQLKEWRAAAEAYQEALDRCDDHCRDLHVRLGYVLFQAGDHEAAARALLSMEIFRSALSARPASSKVDAARAEIEEYAEFYETLPLRPALVLYESYHGASVSCNPLAIYRKLISSPDFLGWTHVWVVRDPADIPAGLRPRSDTIFVRYGSTQYRRYLATARYLINNSTFPSWFIRREGQEYLNTWHGTPLKKLGRDIENGGLADGKNITRNMLQATHIISPNEHTTRVLMGSYDVTGLFNGRLAETGYPRIDNVINGERRAAVLDELKIDGRRPIILYAPTYRGDFANADLGCSDLLADVEALARLPGHVLFRGHYFAERALQEVDLPVQVVPQHIDTCDLLSVVDVLVTDYSSIFFDFLPTGRPICYYTPDLAIYSSARGLYFDLCEMPGVLCRDREGLPAAMAECLARRPFEDVRYDSALARFCPHEHGQSADHAVEFFFRGDDRRVVDTHEAPRRSLLLYGGEFPTNGITSSFLNLLRGLDNPSDRLSVLVDSGRIASDPVKQTRFGQMPKHVSVIGRPGRMVMSPEEKLVIDRFSKNYDLESSAMWHAFERAYRREYRRLLADSRVDVAVNFDGYTRFWAALMAFGTKQETRSIAYLHSDSYSEFLHKFPMMAGLFRLYQRYDALISVSESTHEINRDNLTAKFGLSPAVFAYCRNPLDIRGILAGAEVPIPASTLERMRGRIVFLCVGRLSREKGHEKLLRAFAAVFSDRPDVMLVLLGGGPLRPHLTRLSIELGVEDAVLFMGNVENPYPFYARADLVLLASDYEGQGLTLLEAMALGRPIVATDVTGVRSVLKDGHGLLVENSVEGLKHGMCAFLSGDVAQVPFDSERYQQEAIERFHEIAFGADHLRSAAALDNQMLADGSR